MIDTTIAVPPVADEFLTLMPDNGLPRVYLVTRVRVFGGDARVVVCSELESNPGASITNAADTVYREVHRRWPQAVVLEHYHGENGERFSIVDLSDGEFSGWRHAPLEVVRVLVGGLPKLDRTEPDWVSHVGSYEVVRVDGRCDGA